MLIAATRKRHPCSLTLRNAKYGNVGNDNRQQTLSKLTPQSVLLREIGTGLKCVLWRLGISLLNNLLYFSIAEDLNLGFSYMLDKCLITELFLGPFVVVLFVCFWETVSLHCTCQPWTCSGLQVSRMFAIFWL